MNCNSITDVSSLGKVKILVLDNCNITDVSALGEVFNLTIAYSYSNRCISIKKC